MKTKRNISSINIEFQGKSKILSAIRGIYITNTLRAAIKLELFTLLQNKPLTAEEIKTALNLNGRGLFDFLDALVSLELLNRDGNGKDARYSNTEEVSLFLVKDSKQYIGWSIENKMQEFEQMWGALVEALKTGKPQRQDLKGTGKDLFEIAYDSKDKGRASVEGMNFGQMVSFKDFVKRFDFSGYNTLCDIGGGNGLFSIMVAEQHKHMKCITFDLPALESFARKKIEESDLLDRITIVKGDFFKDDFPRADMITMGNILHDWDLEQKKLLISKAYDVLPDGGALVAIESIIDNERRKNTVGLLMSLNMLLVTEGGFDFTASDFDSWAREAGFKKTAPLPLSGDSSAVIAYKQN
jgi:ubiquinone/menaquinone biosynthesis C-methylase UbiE